MLKNIHVVKLETLAMLANDPLKFSNAKNTCLINLNINLYCVFSSNIYGHPKYYQHQYYHNQLKNLVLLLLSAEKSFETLPKHYLNIFQNR